jgi:putative FmdB family regulatory protein
MPVYTYRCQHCGIKCKKTQMFLDKPLTRCPECRTSTMRRVPQLPAIVFKGSGWYSTDRRSSSGQTSTLREKSGKAESSSGAKTER